MVSYVWSDGVFFLDKFVLQKIQKSYFGAKIIVSGPKNRMNEVKFCGRDVYFGWNCQLRKARILGYLIWQVLHSTIHTTPPSRISLWETPKYTFQGTLTKGLHFVFDKQKTILPIDCNTLLNHEYMQSDRSLRQKPDVYMSLNSVECNPELRIRSRLIWALIVVKRTLTDQS